MEKNFSKSSALLRASAPPRRVCLAALVISFALAGCGDEAIKPNAPAAPAKPLTLAVPASGAYTGAYIAGDEEAITEDFVSLENIERFEEEVGKHQAIIAFSSFWGEQTFPTEAVNIVGRHGSVPLIFWSPWDRPYLENKGPDKFRLDAILAGQWDAYIDQWADAARDYGGPILVSFCNEMNGNWFPWSGFYYGGGDPAPGSPKPKPTPATAAAAPGQQPAPTPDPNARYAGPEFFKKMYRRVVDRVRARGARNVLWVFHVNNFSEPFEPWNRFAQYYPGPDYVDWLGLSAYGQQFPNSEWKDFEAMARAPYEELARVDPGKPMMITEWGIGEFPRRDETTRSGGDKAQWFTEAFENMRLDFPRIRAAIYWHERWQNSAGAAAGFYSNLRVNSSPGALKAYREGIGIPFWLGEPILH